MPFIVVVIGVLLLIAAYNDSMDTLAHELEADIPGYFKWAVAIAAILGLGFIPAMKIPSRYLIASGRRGHRRQELSGDHRRHSANFAGSLGDACRPRRGRTDRRLCVIGRRRRHADASADRRRRLARPPRHAPAAQRAQLAANPLNPNTYVGARRLRRSRMMNSIEPTFIAILGSIFRAGDRRRAWRGRRRRPQTC